MSPPSAAAEPSIHPASDYIDIPAVPVRPDGSVCLREIGGREGPDPTRYGDWEKAGRCIDF